MASLMRGVNRFKTSLLARCTQSQHLRSANAGARLFSTIQKDEKKEENKFPTPFPNVFKYVNPDKSPEEIFEMTMKAEEDMLRRMTDPDLNQLNDALTAEIQKFLNEKKK